MWLSPNAMQAVRAGAARRLATPPRPSGARERPGSGPSLAASWLQGITERV